MNRVRPFAQTDIPAVAALTWQFLYARTGTSPAALEIYLQQLFFLGPFADPNLPSLVYLDNRGEPVGFMGVVARRMATSSGVLRVAFGSNFVVHPDHRTTPASLHLAKSFLDGQQDVSLSDTANEASRAIWEGFGGVAAPMFSRHWSRPLSPMLYALSAVSHFRKRPLPAAFTAVSTPVCRVTDAVAGRACLGRFRAPDGDRVPLQVDTLLAFLSNASTGYPIRPVYENYSLDWLLHLMRHTQARGDLRTIAVRSHTGNTIGCYIYYAKRGGIGEVVFVGSEAQHVDRVLDHLFYDAATQGVIALHGKPEALIPRHLSKRCCFFFDGHDPLLVHSQEPDLMNLVQSGRIFFTRLDGEWCLKFGFDSSAATWAAKELPVQQRPCAVPASAAH